MFERLTRRLVDDIHCAWRWFTTWLNVFGTMVVTYALSDPSVVASLFPMLPGAWRPWAPALGIVWGILVQVARMWKQKPKAVPDGQ